MLLRLLLALVLFLGLHPAIAQYRVYTVPAGEKSSRAAAMPPKALPDTRIGHGNRDIALVWMAQPTERYPHGALGDKVEAASIMVQTSYGQMLSYTLPDDSVFEDLEPRVVDMDDDGLNEILVVHSRQKTGSSLMALGIRNGALVVLAETEPIGARFQWLNPIGAADINGDGQAEVMVVLTPHAEGVLVVYRYANRRFTPVLRIPGVSNHVFGSREQRLFALVDAKKDGIPKLLIPSADRRQLRAFDFHGGFATEFARINVPAPVSGNFEVDGGDTLVPLEDGRRIRIEWLPAAAN